MSDQSYGDDTTPLFTEPVRGIRSWRLSDTCSLDAVAQHYEWTPGENSSACHGSHPRPEEEGVANDDWLERSRLNEAWRATPHSIAECSCGFYGCWRFANVPHRDQGISGIVEGYGDVLIGTKGFRATRARILAIAVEPRGPWVIAEWAMARLRAHYPNVPIFESALALQAEFPVSNPADFVSLEAAS